MRTAGPSSPPVYPVTYRFARGKPECPYILP